MDEIDLKILRLLTQDAQMPFYKVAKIVGISPRTVELRFRKLVRAHIVLQSTILVDLAKIGYAGKAYISITTRPGADQSIITEELKKIEGIFLITQIIGDYDIFALFVFRDLVSVIMVVDCIKKLPGVERADVSFVCDTTYPVSQWVHEQLP